MEEKKDAWICHMAELLVLEILEQMSTIQLKRCGGRGRSETPMDWVCGQVDGEYQMQLAFRAEPKLFRRLAENLLDETPVESEMVRESAREFFNTLCGRFISELYRETKISARFNPVQYEAAPGGSDRKWDGPVSTIYFISDEQEHAEFSWPQRTMEELLKRREVQ